MKLTLNHAALAVLASLAAAPALAQQSAADSAVERCVAADTATRWKQVAAAARRAGDERGTDDSLRARLLALGRADQALRADADSMRSASYVRRMEEGDSANADALMEIVARHGWPTRSRVGREAASAAFLVAQHNPRIRGEALARMLALPPGEVDAQDLALLQDRVLVSEGKPQRFGSQFSSAPGSPDVLELYPIEDIEHVDARRAEVGLFPLGTYLCIMRGVTGQEIRVPLARRP
jgi:hypothetical protein